MYSEDLPFRALLLRSSRLFTDKINAILQPFALNYSLWTVLYVVKNAESCSQIEIANTLEISQPAITKRITTLEKAGFIEFIPTNNRREKIVTLTQKGQAVFDQGEAQIYQLEQQFTRGLTSEQMSQVTQVMKIFLHKLQQENPQ